MKGIIFTLVEDAVVAEHGDDTWDQIIDEAGVTGVYTALGTYPSSELGTLVGAASRVLGVEVDELLRHVGPSAVGRLFDLHPRFVEHHTATRDFLLTLNDVIHVEVRKIHEGANPPDFWFEDGDAGGLVVHYRSARRLCALATGMIEGAAAHFGEQARLDHVQCMLAGADHCILDVRFSDAGGGPR